MTYIRYSKSNKKFHRLPGNRPTNQSAPSALDKIAERMETLFKDNRNLTCTELQEKYLEEIEQLGSQNIGLLELGIDIAHNIAISVIIDEIVYRMNNPTIANKAVNQFIEDIITTDDDPSKKTIKEFFKELTDSSISVSNKLSSANWVIERLNCASKNLFPGNKSPNRSLRAAQDKHYVKNAKKGNFVEIPASIKLSESQIDFFQHRNYGPRTRINLAGKTEIQSSSIHKNKDEAWIAPSLKK